MSKCKLYQSLLPLSERPWSVVTCTTALTLVSVRSRVGSSFRTVTGAPVAVAGIGQIAGVDDAVVILVQNHVQLVVVVRHARKGVVLRRHRRRNVLEERIAVAEQRQVQRRAGLDRHRIVMLPDTVWPVPVVAGTSIGPTSGDKLPSVPPTRDEIAYSTRLVRLSGDRGSCPP